MVGGGQVSGGEEKRGETRKVREVTRGKTPRHDARSHRLETRCVAMNKILFITNLLFNPPGGLGVLGPRNARGIHESRSRQIQGILEAREALGSAANVRRHV